VEWTVTSSLYKTVQRQEIKWQKLLVSITCKTVEIEVKVTLKIDFNKNLTVFTTRNET